MVAPFEDIQKARGSVKTCLSDDSIPVFEASEIDVTRNNEFEMILYCGRLQSVKEDCILSTLDIDVKNLCIVRLLGIHEQFATSDILMF